MNSLCIILLCIPQVAVSSFLRGLNPWYVPIAFAHYIDIRARSPESATTVIPESEEPPFYGLPTELDANDFYLVHLDGSVTPPSPSRPSSSARWPSPLEEGVFVYRKKDGTTFVFDGESVNEFSDAKPTDAASSSSLSDPNMKDCQSELNSTTTVVPVDDESDVSSNCSFEGLGRLDETDPSASSSSPCLLESSSTTTTEETTTTSPPITASALRLNTDEREYLRTLYDRGSFVRSRVGIPFGTGLRVLPFTYYMAHQAATTVGASVDGGYYVLPPGDAQRAPPASSYPSLLPPLFLLRRPWLLTTSVPSLATTLEYPEVD